jgi:hypothetical protein
MFDGSVTCSADWEPRGAIACLAKTVRCSGLRTLYLPCLQLPHSHVSPSPVTFRDSTSAVVPAMHFHRSHRVLKRDLQEQKVQLRCTKELIIR